MRQLFGLLALFILCPFAHGEQDPADLYELLKIDRGAFARQLTSDLSNDFEKADSIVKWLATNLEWKATDYQQRTVQQIIDRKGGNCNELAQVAISLFDELEMPMRRVREINLHKKSDRRQETAGQMVKERGNRLSVFGRQHNDHVWIEIYDRNQQKWFPADPSLGLVGEEAWLRARLGFGVRQTLDPTSEDMIAPFAIFVLQPDSEPVDRTQFYVIDGFDRIYDGRLHDLPAWSNWTRLINLLSRKARGAFLGENNFHEYNDQIAELGEVYDQLKAQYEGLESGRP